MKKFLLGACLFAAAASPLLSGTAAQAATLSSGANLKATDSELFDLFKSAVNTEGLALNEQMLPELNADSLRWDGIASDIDVVFIDEGAGYRNQLFYSLNDGPSTMIFDDIASPESSLSERNGPLSLGDSMSIGDLAGSMSIDFLLKANGARNANGHTYSADVASNPDGLQHVIAREYKHGEDNWVLLGFEDLYGVHRSEGGSSDRDFNDVVVAVRGVTGDRTNSAQVPEPATTAGLFAIGALAFTQVRRRQQTS